MYDQDDINLLFVLRQHGWSELILYVGGQVQQLCVSHVFSNPVSDLIQLAGKLHQRSQRIELLLWDEPGGHSLVFKQVITQHHLYDVWVSSFPEGYPDEKRTETVLLEFRVKADHFVKLIYAELAKLLALLEDKNYRNDREFPYQEFKSLSELLGK